jgi:hypothetical protein
MPPLPFAPNCALNSSCPLFPFAPNTARIKFPLSQNEEKFSADKGFFAPMSKSLIRLSRIVFVGLGARVALRLPCSRFYLFIFWRKIMATYSYTLHLYTADKGITPVTGSIDGDTPANAAQAAVDAAFSDPANSAINRIRILLTIDDKSHYDKTYSRPVTPEKGGK